MDWDETTIDYTYDAANQLPRIDGSDGSFTELSYDANGNLKGKVRWKATKGKKAPASDDRLLRVEISRGKSSVTLTSNG